jgi:hypothetical protein
MKNAILSDPCMCTLITKTYHPSNGLLWPWVWMGVVPTGQEAATNQAVHNYHKGRGFNMMTKDSTTVLHPVCFGGGNEVWLHLYLGKVFASDFAMNKCRHMLFGQRFVWITDCYVAKFFLSYGGANPAIL